MPLFSHQYGFIAGEISPELISRTDTDKYDYGLTKAENVVIDYRGGVSRRLGLEFLDHAMFGGAESEVRISSFQYSPEIRDSYLLVWGNNYLRFMQNGGYILEEPKFIANVDVTTGVVGLSNHGFSTGDWVFIKDVPQVRQINGQTYVVEVLTPNTFRISHPMNVPLNTPSWDSGTLPGGTAARVYTISTPYPQAALSALSLNQWGNTVEITSTNYWPRLLQRITDTNWTLERSEFSADLARPAKPTGTASSGGSAEVSYEVTQVDENGRESRASERGFTTGSVNWSVEAGSLTITWPAVDGAFRYNIYRSLIYPNADSTSYSDDVGYLGTSYGPRFVDNNIVPDFTTSPPLGFNPFARSRIESISVTAGGSGYALGDTITVTDAGGSGFVGYPVIDPSSGAILSIYIINGGEEYNSPSISVTTSAGSGAAFSVTLGPDSGTFPAVSAVFQQRKVYAGSLNDVLNIWGSRPGDFENFDYSLQPSGIDAYTYTLDGSEAAPIRHILPNESSLLIFTQSQITGLRGEDDTIVSAVSAKAEPIVFEGAGRTKPIKARNSILFTGTLDRTLNVLEFDSRTRRFGVNELTAYASHFFADGDTIKEMAWIEGNLDAVIAVTERGYLLVLTYRPREEVYAWTRCLTNGLFTSISVVREAGRTVPYFVVRRRVQGQWHRTIERFPAGGFNQIEDSFFVDGGLRRELEEPDSRLEADSISGTNVRFRAREAVFATSDVNSTLFYHDGKARLHTFVSDQEMIGDYLRPTTKSLGTTTRGAPAYQGEWSFGLPIQTLYALHHLEGKTVSALVDGHPFENLEVSNGQITLPQEGTKISIGMPFSSTVQTLPVTLRGEKVEALRKRITTFGLFLFRVGYLAVGADLERLRPLRLRSTEAWGEPTSPATEYYHGVEAGSWDEEGRLYFFSDKPLPFTVLGAIRGVEYEDA